MKSPEKRVAPVRSLSLILPVFPMPILLMHSEVLARTMVGDARTSSVVTSRLAGTGALQGPQCTLGPGSVITTSFQISNTFVDTEIAGATMALPAQLVAIPGSCVYTSGTSCAVLNPQSMSYSGVLLPGEEVTITFKSQVADATPPALNRASR